MGPTLGDVLHDVRNVHPAFDSSRVPDPVLQSRYASYQPALIRKAIGRDKTFLADLVVVPVPATIDPAVPLEGVPNVLAPVGGALIRTSGHRELLWWESVARRLEAGRSVTLLNGRIFLNGAAADWRAIASIELVVIPQPPPLKRREDPFLLPESARECLVAAGAQWAAHRVTAFESTVDAMWYDAEAQRAEREFLSALRLPHRARVSTMREGAY